MAATARLRFSELWQRLGATEAGNHAFDELAAAHSKPGRVYHTLDHVLDCLARLDEAEGTSDDRDLVEAALWFHDVVYDPHRADNESRSAQWAARALSAAGVPLNSVDRVGELIRMTAHSRPPSDPLGSLLCDVDLSILGRGELEFDEYQRRIREEYAWVPDPLYRAARARILSTFLQRDRIFLTDYFRDRYEASARTNLRRALDRLGT